MTDDEPIREEDAFVLPASSAQQRLWFLEQLHPGSPLYNVAFALRARGPLSVPLLERALHHVVERHEVLRTCLALDGDRVVQIVAPRLDVPVRVVDVRAPEGADPWDAAREHARTEARRPFDVARGPLLDVSVLRVARDDALLVLAMHHAISDGWSMRVFVRELVAAYEAAGGGREPDLPELTLQYGDYAEWQERRLHDGSLDGELAYWRRALDGAPEALRLPADRPRPEELSTVGARRAFALDGDVAARLHAFCEARAVTPFMALLAAFDVLLARLSLQEDLLVATPVANRTRAELEPLIGMFVNTVVVRADLRGDPSFFELVERVKRASVEAFAHQEVPFERVVEAVKPSRAMNRAPLVQAMFVFQNFAPAEIPAGAITFEPVPLDLGIARFDVTLALSESARGFSGTFEYAAALWDAETIDRWLSAFRALLDEALSRPHDPISRLSLGLPAARGADVPIVAADASPRLAISRFEAQARSKPDAIAVTDRGAHVTYGELDRRASVLARRLRDLGVATESRVAVCLDRSVDFVAAVLAVAKCGAAYVPLDPAHASSRLDAMIGDAKPAALLVGKSTRGLLQAPGATPVVEIGSDTWRGAPAARFEAPLDAAAYVIFTSGSTGLPKGVVVSNRSLAGLLDASPPEFAVGPSDTWPAWISPSFDPSVWEMWSVLTRGARLLVVPREVIAAPVDLYTLLVEERATVLVMTPSAFAHVVETDAVLRRSLALRVVGLGGESLSPSALQAWLSRHATPVVNLYGPTEATVNTTSNVIESGDVRETRSIIGRPVKGAIVRILDRHAREVPTGFPGEIYVGGAGVARGYLDRPALTAERFVPDASATRPGARLYRTGDFGRRLPDGRIEFWGRADGQVKLRGMRVEVGEVQAALARDSSIASCAVIPRSSRGGVQLVAYVVARSGVDVDVAALRTRARKALPDHMVPSAFVVVPALPTTVNGKLDVSALPEPASGSTGAEPPSGVVEEAIASVFRDVLGVASVGRDDDFFDLGGHSLMAATAVSRIRASLGVDLGIRDFFREPRVTALATRATAALARSGAAPVRLAPGPLDAPGPLSFAQERFFFLEELSPGNPAHHVPVVVRIQGSLDVRALERALRDLSDRHAVLRTTFVREAGVARQIARPDVGIDLVAREAPSDEALLRRALIDEICRPFDLTRGPLLRASLLERSGSDHLLALTMHHIVSDGWSMGVLVRELTACYAARAAGAPPALPPLPIQYADYARWQRATLDGPALDALVTYWKKTLAGAPRLELPTDRPRPKVQSFRGARHVVDAPDRLARGLNELARREAATLFMVLVAALQLLLARKANQRDVSVGTPVANRDMPETEPLIGCFINVVVLRTDVDPDRPFRELLARVKQTSLDAFAHQALPFDKLVQELAPDRDPAWPPIVQALFVLQNASVPRLEAADVTISPHPIPVETTKYDLRVSVTETAERMPFVFEYCADLFEPATIEAFAAAFFALLDRIVASPTALVSELGEAVAPRAASAPAKRKFTAVAPRPVDVRGAELVREARLVGDGDDDVLVVSPAQKYVDLAGWIATNRADVTARLDRHGAILFRGFELGSLERFAAVTRAVCPDLLKYSYRSTPRTELLEGVYSSTEYPADQHIPLHNESAYALSWPLKIFFYCLVPPGGGGQTPIAFSTRVYERISPAVRARFERDGVMYVRNYGAGLDLAWQEVFQTNDPREVEAYCDAQRISVEWLPEGRLRTRQVCQGVARHPVSGAPLWFNQAHLFHVSSLPEPVRGALLERFRQEELPRNTFYGDGSPIEAAALDEVREAYRASEIVFDWRADDVLLLDNMRVAHGRRPFTGPRRIAAAMAEPFSIASQVT